MSRDYQYSDVDVDFNKNEFVNDVSVKYDRNAIRQSVINLVLTRSGEKPFNRGYGVGLHNMLFENISPLDVVLLEKQIASQFVAYEPRVSLISVDFDDINQSDLNRMDVTINYAIMTGTKDPIKESISLTLGKVR